MKTFTADFPGVYEILNKFRSHREHSYERWTLYCVGRVAAATRKLGDETKRMAAASNCRRQERAESFGIWSTASKSADSLGGYGLDYLRNLGTDCRQRCIGRRRDRDWTRALRGRWEPQGTPPERLEEAVLI